MATRSVGFITVLWAILWSTVPCLPAWGSPALLRTLDQIFNREDFHARKFDSVVWLEGGSAYAMLEPSAPNSGAKDIVRYETATAKRSVMVSAHQLIPAPGAKPLSIESYSLSKDENRVLLYTHSVKVWRQNTRGDYWVFDRAHGRLRKLGGDAPASSLMFAQLAPDGDSVAYVHGNNIYVEDPGSGVIRSLTTDGSQTVINGTSDWVNEEELSIRCGFLWSPDGSSIAYWQFDTSGVGVYTLINDTAAEYPILTQYPYPQVGSTNSSVRIGVVDIRAGSTRWMEIPGDSRQHYVVRMLWAENSVELALEYLNRLQNSNQLLLADTHTGDVRRIFEDTDPAWVDIMESLQWTDGGKSLIWLSERDGWRHAYKVSMTDGRAQLLTSTPSDVIEPVAIDDRHGWFYYVASPANATERFLYRARLDGGGPLERVTPAGETGTHSYNISPDGTWAFHTHSDFDHPPSTTLVRLADHKMVRVVESNDDLIGKARELIPSPVEFFEITIREGVRLDGWLIKPAGFDPAKKYPVLVYVYGEPAAVTVTNEWGNERNLFHRAIANDGYLVVSFDNQGTPAPKGRTWRKMVFGSLGPLSSEQQAAAIRELAKERAYIDSSRMAIWGWSGGGSNTLNLMFRSPGLFSAGMAVAPMADQRYYDTIYQERYMGLPKDNPQGYFAGSPINFAQGLKGKLLIVHGSGDDNCHFKVTELLLNRLIEIGKQFDFMDYPNRTHAISEGPGTSFHLFSLLARYLEDHVAPGALPQ